jgi:hypothetical protein
METEPRGMASTRHQSAAVIDNSADKDALANGFVGHWYALFSSFIFVPAHDSNV